MIDFFGTKPSFNYKRHESSKSTCGVFATYGFIIFTLWAIYHVGNDIFYRNNPKAFESEQFFGNPDETNISPEIFNMAFGLQHPATFEHYIDETIYRVVATWNQRKTVLVAGTPTTIPTSETLTLERCTKEHFGDLEDSTKTLPLSNLFCFRKEDKALLRLQGRFESPMYEYVTVDFYPCDPGGAVTCKDSTVINAALDGAYFAAYYTDLAIDPQNYSHPEGRFLDSKFTTFGQGYYKEYSFFVRHISVKSDVGWLFSQNNKHDFISFDRVQENVDFREFDSFFRLVLRVSTMKTFWTRTYIKLQDILAELDGLLTLFVIIVAIVVYPYIKTKYFEELTNDIFDVKIYRWDQNKKKDVEKMPTKRSFNRRASKKRTGSMNKVHTKQELLSPIKEENLLQSPNKEDEDVSLSREIVKDLK